VIAKVIQKRSKMQLQRGVKGNLRLLPAAVTAENAPFADQSRCAFRFLRTFVITSISRIIKLKQRESLCRQKKLLTILQL
jgi:hypothetical protein